MDFFLRSVFPGGEGEEDGGGAAAGPQGGLGGLVKTLASRSESAMQACRRDLGEFGAGLLQESAALSQALRGLPSSLAAGAGVPRDFTEPAGDEIPADGSQDGEARADLVKRVIASRQVVQGEEENLSWEVDDDEDEEDTEEEQAKGRKQGLHQEEQPTEEEEEEEEEEEASIAGGNPIMADGVAKLDDEIPLQVEGKAEPIAKSCEDGDVSCRPDIPDVDEVGWDEIGDLILGDDDDHDDDDEKKKAGVSDGGGGPRKMEDLRKRLSAAQEDEDLSWDIEDDDEPFHP